MLIDPTMEKLFALRLQGRLEGLNAQQKNPAVNEQRFRERLAMQID